MRAACADFPQVARLLICGATPQSQPVAGPLPRPHAGFLAGSKRHLPVSFPRVRLFWVRPLLSIQSPDRRLQEVPQFLNNRGGFFRWAWLQHVYRQGMTTILLSNADFGLQYGFR